MGHLLYRKRLFLIGNGFDLDHDLPTDFEKNFKQIAESNESNKDFWNLYQSYYSNIWSDFEYALGCPDFNSLEEIFDEYAPDYASDHESDRDQIIVQADISGNLNESLTEFADQAEEAIDETVPKDIYKNIFKTSDLFINFNYTHTLEKLYSIRQDNILHVHGEVGKNNLILGYPRGMYKPEKYKFDPTLKGRSLIELDIRDFIKRMAEEELFDSYTYRAFELLIEKTESFYKEFQKEKLESFLRDTSIGEIIVFGHSCKIDFDYFKYLNEKYVDARWFFNPHCEQDVANIEKLIEKFKINKYKINPIGVILNDI